MHVTEYCMDIDGMGPTAMHIQIGNYVHELVIQCDSQHVIVHMSHEPESADDISPPSVRALIIDVEEPEPVDDNINERFAMLEFE